MNKIKPVENIKSIKKGFLLKKFDKLALNNVFDNVNAEKLFISDLL